MESFYKLVEILKENSLHISAAESCTGGMFASEIVSIPDASWVLSASFVTYSEEAKNKFAFVPFETIENYGVVSEETAIAMAKGAAENAGAEIGVGITGFAGPSGGDDFAEKGTVCFGFALPGTEKTFRLKYDGMERNEIRAAAVKFAAETLYGLLKELY